MAFSKLNPNTFLLTPVKDVERSGNRIIGRTNMKDGFYSVKLVDGAKWYLDDLPTDSDFLATFGEEEE